MILEYQDAALPIFVEFQLEVRVASICAASPELDTSFAGIECSQQTEVLRQLRLLPVGDLLKLKD